MGLWFYPLSAIDIKTSLAEVFKRVSLSSHREFSHDAAL